MIALSNACTVAKQRYLKCWQLPPASPIMLLRCIFNITDALFCDARNAKNRLPT